MQDLTLVERRINLPNGKRNAYNDITLRGYVYEATSLSLFDFHVGLRWNFDCPGWPRPWRRRLARRRMLGRARVLGRLLGMARVQRWFLPVLWVLRLSGLLLLPCLSILLLLSSLRSRSRSNAGLPASNNSKRGSFYCSDNACLPA